MSHCRHATNEQQQEEQEQQHVQLLAKCALETGALQSVGKGLSLHPSDASHQVKAPITGSNATPPVCHKRHTRGQTQSSRVSGLCSF